MQMEKDLIIGSEILVLMKELDAGFLFQRDQVVLRAWATDYTRAVQLHLERENIYKAVISGMVRVLVLLACIAGAGLAGGTGTTAAAIKKRSSGGEFS